MSGEAKKKRRRWPRVLLAMALVVVLLVCALAARVVLHARPPAGDPRASYDEIVDEAHDGQRFDGAAWSELIALTHRAGAVATPFRQELLDRYEDRALVPGHLGSMLDYPCYWTDWHDEDLDAETVAWMNDLMRRCIDAYDATDRSEELRSLLDAGTLRAPAYDPGLAIWARDFDWARLLREFSGLEVARAVRAHERGDEADALDALENVLDLILALARYPAALDRLMASSELARVLSVIDAIIEMRAPEPGTLERLADALERFRAAYPIDARHIDAERYVVLETIGRMYTRSSQFVEAQIVMPGHRELAARINAYYDAALRWSALPAHQRAASPDHPETIRAAFEREHPDLDAFLFNVVRMTRALTVNATLLDAAIVRVALERHRAEHGAYPRDLRSLVTAGTLTALPTDTHAPDGAFRYRPTDDGYLFYSVGRDGVDDNGAFDPEHPERFHDTPGTDTLLR